MLKTPEPEVVAELEKLGSNEVRAKLARGEYGEIGATFNYSSTDGCHQTTL